MFSREPAKIRLSLVKNLAIGFGMDRWNYFNIYLFCFTLHFCKDAGDKLFEFCNEFVEE
jgi:hypothetical protein